MALATTHPTLLDVTKRSKPGGQIDMIAEILEQRNEILEDMVWVQGNLETGHRTTQRTGLPTPTWRKLNAGVVPTKSDTAQITDTCAMLEAYAEVDAKLAKLNGNTAAFRLSEDRGHIEGMAQEHAQTLFYGNEALAPNEFTGLAPRFNNLTTMANSENVIAAAGAAAGNDQTSVWLVVWGPNTVHGIYPKGTVGGLQMTDKGQVTRENADYSVAGASGAGMFEVFRTHYEWNCGLTVRDWRFVVRIANIDATGLTDKLSTTTSNLIDRMSEATELIPNLSAGRPVFYANRKIKSILKRQLADSVTNSTLQMSEAGGKHVLSFDSIPVRRCDAILNTETLVGA